MVYILYNPYHTRRITSPCGEADRTVYKKIFCEDTRCYKLVPVEKVSRYAEIQSYLGESAIDLCCKRLLCGDTNVTIHDNGVYCDIAEIPGDFNSCFKTFKQVENAFNSLPKEVIGDSTNLKSFLKTLTDAEGLKGINERLHAYCLSKAPKKPVETDGKDGTINNG